MPLPPRRSLLAVGLGGGVGALVRHVAVDRLDATPAGIPVTTLAVNLVGALALGVVVVAAVERGRGRWWLRPLVGTGLLGALTTVSSFATQVVLLERDGRLAAAVAYVCLTVGGGLATAAVGVAAARRWVRPRVAPS